MVQKTAKAVIIFQVSCTNTRINRLSKNHVH